MPEPGPLTSDRRDAIAGCLIGTAVGDAIGLPYEGLSPRRAARLLGPPDRHRLLFGRGMLSDDTEHTCMVLLSLLSSQGDLSRFQKDFAARLRYWLLTLPAGTGLATARAILKLWCGFPPSRSGVFSAGNGPAMRAAILGVMLPLDQLDEYVAANCLVTHSDPKAKWGALAVALAAHLASRNSVVAPQEYLALLAEQLKHEPAGEFLNRIEQAIAGLSEFPSTMAFSEQMASPRGVSGYVYQTVPVAIHAWLRHPHDYPSAIEQTIRCGGDTDTTAAIVGGIVGSAVGVNGIPEPWRNGIGDWPLSVNWMLKLADVAAEASPSNGRNSPALPFVPRIARNLVFLPIVLTHGFRRLAPPY